MRLIHPLPVIGAPTGVPVVASQSRTVQSLLPVATIRPSGLKAMKFTGASGLIGCPTGRIVARAEHRPFTRMPSLARWFEIRVPAPGDTYTVNASRVSLRPDATTGELYLDEHGPGLRALYDLAEPRRSRMIHSSGRSCGSRS